MGKLSERLVDKDIENWVVHNERFEARSDGANLWIRFRKNDLYPRWFFRYTFGGKQRFIGLGSYRDVSIKAARKEAAKLRGRIASGVDVAMERKARVASLAEAALEAKLTVAWLADEYFERYVANRVKHPNIVRAMIENRIKPAMGKIALVDVQPSDVDRLIRNTASTAPTVSTKLLSRLKLIFNLGVKLGHIRYNPAAAFDAQDAGGFASPRTRWLTRDELICLFSAMRIAIGWNVQNTLAVKLLLMLAVRKSELLQARIDEFDLDEGVWRLPAERTKSSSAIDIPLPLEAVTAVQELIRLGAGSEWLFPARKMRTRMTPYVSADTLNAALAKSIRPRMNRIEPFVIHDFRRTARTHLEALGVGPWVAERCLNHKVKGLVGVYNRHDYFEERKVALDRWAGYLVALDKAVNPAENERMSS